jgi:DNA-binding transcriptional ArsR family regulator
MPTDADAGVGYDQVPNDTEAEQAVLGSVFKDPASFLRAADLLAPGDFYDSKHRLIWTAWRELQREARPIEYHTTSDKLRQLGTYDQAGGLVYLSEINLATPTAAFIEYYARIVVEHAIRRRAISSAQTLAETAYRRADISVLAEYVRNVSEDLTSVAGGLAQAAASRDEFDLADLADDDDEDDEIPSLPLLGVDGYFIEGWANILAAYPKVGKTELLVACCGSWLREGRTILYISEESRKLWRLRVSRLEEWPRGMRVYCGLHEDPRQLLRVATVASEQVVIVDTIRNLLGFQDERDNSEVARRLNPWIDAARDGNKTLIFVHHMRKGGGEHGEGIAGAHALLGAVDVALELAYDPHGHNNRRRVRAYTRLEQPDELEYERLGDGTFRCLGSPLEVEEAALRLRLLDALLGAEDPGWVRTNDLRGGLGDPVPSERQTRDVLNALATEGAILRDPPMALGAVPGRTVRWGHPQRVASDGASEAGGKGQPDSARKDFVVPSEVAVAPTREQLLSAVVGVVARRELAEALPDVPERTVSYWLTRLVTEGLLVRCGPEGGPGDGNYRRPDAEPAVPWDQAEADRLCNEAAKHLEALGVEPDSQEYETRENAVNAAYQMRSLAEVRRLVYQLEQDVAGLQRVGL